MSRSEYNPIEQRLYGHAIIPRDELHALLVKHRELADRWGEESKRARRVRDQIVLANQRLVLSIACRYKRLPKGWQTADLLSYGNMGLIEGVKRFDPKRGIALSTYAAWWIRHAIGRALADFGNAVRVPVHAQDAVARVRKGEQPKNSKVVESAAVALQAAYSLDAPLGGPDSRTTYADLVEDANAVDVLGEMEHRQDAERLAVAIARLPPKHHAVIRARMDGRTLADVGESADRSRERVRQMEQEAYAMLRRELGAA